MTVPLSGPDRLTLLLGSETYWTARAMREQGSRFYRALGEALEAADLGNRRLIYAAWTDAIWDFYERGLRLEAEEGGSGEG
ncbi:hypothetical protein [Deinococcus aestuarii]|uniref:hypothetical protein n=1 Tax=Deinococcus aestuarii TaxID=2774531 RepID=UPI001C0C7DA1|nr:hypothetical protein [Deinococcus aestuarii]